MERFYGELAAGRPADEALRRAQLALLGRADTAHPSYWAAFQLHGAAGAAGRSGRGRPSP
jgi:CHAT domain-containing protein